MECDSPGIELVGEALPRGADLAWLVDALGRCAQFLPAEVDRATIAFVTDAHMKGLHERFSRDPSTTDVLTFATNEPGRAIECDIAVCVDEASRRAAELGHTTRQELLLYALHGLLHACGYDDLDPAAHAAMHAEEDRILVAAGIGPIFSPDQPARNHRDSKGPAQ
ncbi:MAG: rRNA maturation RNase YbeY [Phycisphaerae bacterium]|nr:rRNA maturation RNase YbeY [Phycisphaerae bacterium]